MSYRAVRLAFIFSAISALTDANEGPIAHTIYGDVQGYTLFSRWAINYRVFQGIPYAKPPLGQLRFQPPQPPDSWKELRQATDFPPKCPQINSYWNISLTGSEDCLYLTVYTRKLDANVPVLVHFHDGGWISGDGPTFQTPEFLMDHDIVVVDVNYRLGILGFLSFEDEVLPGNMGLKDQAMALKWVQENVRNFGGNSKLVTIIGEGTGADSVYHHMLSPMSRGMFHRAIAESGSSYSAMALTPRGLASERAVKLANIMQCYGDSREMLACLREKDALDITSKITEFLDWQIDPLLTFGPVLEIESPTSFLELPMSKWSPAKVPLLTGITSAEGLIRTKYFKDDSDLADLTNGGFNSLMPVSLMLKNSTSNPEEKLTRIMDYYLSGENNIDMSYIQNLTDIYSDGLFSYGVIEGANMANGDVYLYYFDFVSQGTMSQFFGNKKKEKGAFHADESRYLWQSELVPPFYGVDLEISLDIVILWINFVITGNPTPNNDLGFKWTKYKPGDNYLHITKDGFKMEQNLLTERLEFWKSLNPRESLF